MGVLYGVFELGRPHGEFTDIVFTILVDLEPIGWPKIAQLTQRVVKKVDQITNPTLLAVVKGLLVRAYNLETKMALQLPIGEWAQVMADVATAARACWRGHLGVHTSTGTMPQAAPNVRPPMGAIRPLIP